MGNTFPMVVSGESLIKISNSQAKRSTTFAKTQLLLCTDLQWLVAGMADPSGDRKMVAPPPPSYKKLKQLDKVSSPMVIIFLDLGI
jgi:hypothetical protein